MLPFKFKITSENSKIAIDDNTKKSYTGSYDSTSKRFMLEEPIKMVGADVTSVEVEFDYAGNATNYNFYDRKAIRQRSFRNPNMYRLNRMCFDLHDHEYRVIFTASGPYAAHLVGKDIYYGSSRYTVDSTSVVPNGIMLSTTKVVSSKIDRSEYDGSSYDGSSCSDTDTDDSWATESREDYPDQIDFEFIHDGNQWVALSINDATYDVVNR